MKKTLSLLLISFSVTGMAQNYDSIFDDVGRFYDIDPLLIKAHCVEESSLDPTAVNDKNSDGTIDKGLCQINSFWKPMLREHGITDKMLFDPNVSIAWAGYVINHNFHVGGRNNNSIGAYNAGWKKKDQAARDRYAAKIKARYQKLKNLSFITSKPNN